MGLQKNTKIRLLISVLLGFIVLFSCTKHIDDEVLNVSIEEIVILDDLSTQNSILAVHNIFLSGEAVSDFTSQIMQSDNYISVTLPENSDLSNVSIDFELSENATLKFGSDGLNFTGTGVKMFTVVAANGNERTYALKINAGEVEPEESPNEITSVLSILDNTVGSLVVLENTEIEFIDNDIKIVLPVGTVITNLSFEFEYTTTSILLDDSVNLNFEDGQTNTVAIQGEDAEVRTYTIEVTVQEDSFLSDENDILGITITTGDEPAEILYENDAPVFDNNTIVIELPCATDLSDLNIQFTLSEFANLEEGTLTENLDFTNAEAKVFTVVAQDLVSTQQYAIDIIVAGPTIDQQKAALLAMYNGTSNWNIDLDLAEWEGITVDAEGNVIEFEQDGSIGFQPITAFDENLGCLIYLESLTSMNTGLESIPNEIGNLTSLDWLDLRYNNLETINSEVRNLISLTLLYVGYNKLTTVPEWLSELTNLTHLGFNFNNLGAVPELIGELTNLTVLGLVANNLTSLPADIITKLTNLKTLYITENENLTVIPQAICDMELSQGLVISKDDDITICGSLIAEGEAFITTWTGTEVTIPINTSYTYNYNVDWDNDGILDEFGITGEATHTYDTAGPHTIQITGEFPAISFGSLADPNVLVGLEQWGTGEWLSMEDAFLACENLIVSATDTPNLDGVLSMENMFSGATLANPDVSGWDVSNVTNMTRMFLNAISADPAVGGWDVSSVTDMTLMFAGISTNPDVSDWDVSNVTNMSSMFSKATLANPDVSGWDVSSVNNMSTMFTNAISADPDVSGWDVSSVTDMRGMFQFATSADPDVSGWDVSSVIDLSFLFNQSRSANPNVSGWDTSNVNDMSYMFSFSGVTNPDFSNWDITSVIDMSAMFNAVTLDTEVYDKVLEDLASKVRNNDVEFGGGNSTYCNEIAWQVLTDTGWIIDDSGPDANCEEVSQASFDITTGILTASVGSVGTITLSSNGIVGDSYEGNLLIRTVQIEADGTTTFVAGSSNRVDQDNPNVSFANLSFNGDIYFVLEGTHVGTPGTSSTTITIAVDGEIVETIIMSAGSPIPR